MARTAREANRIIASIARDNEVEKIVKGKSMTAEETFLNDHLEKEGFQVTETDLGEWIIQLRHEGPSHMVMPAIHLSRQEVAELFTKVTGTSQDPDDINGMVKVARKELRQAFLEADMGISGANFAIAESGTIALLTNEGNGRLVTTLPRVHVALVGFDKLVPDLRIGPAHPSGPAAQRHRSGHLHLCHLDHRGHRMLNRPRRPQRFHIVFLDNGRLALAKDPVFAEALRCIRCGACANVCPIYRMVGGHNYGHVYIGAIGLILTYFYHGRENARAIVQNCLNCQACKAVCPTGIDLAAPDQGSLSHRAAGRRRKAHEEPVAGPGARRPQAVSLSAAPRLSGAETALRTGPYLRHLPFLFGKEHDFRRLPVVASTPCATAGRASHRVEKPRYRVALFGGLPDRFRLSGAGRGPASNCSKTTRSSWNTPWSRAAAVCRPR